MSDRLTAEPGTLEFLRQLLEIAQESDHPMDKALTKVLSKHIGETQAVRPFDGAPLDQARDRQGRQGSPQAEGRDNGLHG